MESGKSTFHIREVLTEEQLGALRDMLAYHQRLSPEVRQFLVTVDEHTLDWLRTARPEEIDEIIQGIKLIGNLRAVLKWLRAIIIIIGGIYVARQHFSDFMSFFSSLTK